MALPIFDEKGTKVNPNSNEFYDFNPGDWSNFYQQTSPQPVGNTTQPIASSLSGGSYGGYFDAGPNRGFISPEQGQRMLKNPDAFKATPSELRLIREGLGLPRASAGGEIGEIASASPGEGFAWFGDPKGDGRWSIDTESDRWSPDIIKSIKSGRNQPVDDSELGKIKRSLPGWFGFTSYNPETGAVRGYSRHSGGSGVIRQGGDLKAEHYGQPGSWSVDWDMRPDGSARNVVGDYWWGKNPDTWSYTAEDWHAAAAKDTPYLSTDEAYSQDLSEQQDRMRSKIMEKVLAGDKYAPQQLADWDFRYGQEDLARGKHFTQAFSEQDTAAKQKQLAKEKGFQRGTLETDRADTGPTLAQIFNNPQAGQRILRGIRDELRGDLIDNKAVTGLPSFDEFGDAIVFDPNFQGKEGSKLTKLLPESIRPDAKGYGAALDDIGTARMYQDIGATRGTPFGTKDGQFILRDIPEQSRIDRMSLKNPLGSKVSRGFSGASEVQLPHGTPGRLTSADEVAELATKAAAKKGGKKLAARAIPFVGTGLGAWDVGSRLMKKDWQGAALGAISMIPGPVGWGGLTLQGAHDVGDGDIGLGALKIKDWLTPSGPIKGRKTGSQRRAQRKARGSTYNQALDRNVLTIAGKGGSPGQPYDAPKEDPKNPWVPAPKRINV